MATSLDTSDTEISDQEPLVVSLKQMPGAQSRVEGNPHAMRTVIVPCISAVRHSFEKWLKERDSSYKLDPPEGVEKGLVRTSSPVLYVTATAAVIAEILNPDTRPSMLKIVEAPFVPSFD